MPSAGNILRELHIPWPAANEAGLREAAIAWHGLAESIRDSYGVANSCAASLTTNNAGAAIDAFEKYWKQYGGAKGALPLAASACDALSRACSQYADAVAETKRKIEEIGAAAAAALVIGTVGAIFTFGASEAAADATAVSLAGLAASAIESLGLAVADGVAVFAPVVATAIDSATVAASAAVTAEGTVAVAGSVLANAASGAGGALIGDATQNVLGHDIFGLPTVTAPQELHDTLGGAVGGGVSGGLGSLGEMGGTALAKVLSTRAGQVATSDPQLYVDMMTLSKSLEGMPGKVSAAVVATAASQLMQAQQVSAEGLASNAVQEAVLDTRG